MDTLDTPLDPPLHGCQESNSESNCMMLVCFTVGVFLVSCGCVITQMGLSTSEEQDLLATHNYYRSHVRPMATDMQIMVKCPCT